MHRIDTTDVEPDKWGTGKDGFKDAVGVGQSPTRLNADWFDSVQEELANAIEGSAVTLDPANDQLLSVLDTIRSYRLHPCANLEKFTGGIGGSPSEAIFLFNNGVTPIHRPAWVGCGNTNGWVGYSYDGREWVDGSAGSGFAGSFWGIASAGSDGIVVAVGSAGEIQTTPNGDPGASFTWTRRETGAGYTLNSVSYGNGLFVTVGDSGEIRSSSNGTAWTHRTAASSYASAFADVIYAGGLWVAVGSAAEIQTSSDGITWTRRNTGSGVFYSVCYSAALAKFFAVGTAGVYSSADGITWTAVSAIPGLSGHSVYGVAVMRGVVVVFTDKAILTSEDGVTFVQSEWSITIAAQVRTNEGATDATTRYVVVSDSIYRTPALMG